MGVSICNGAHSLRRLLKKNKICEDGHPSRSLENITRNGEGEDAQRNEQTCNCFDSVCLDTEECSTQTDTEQTVPIEMKVPDCAHHREKHRERTACRVHSTRSFRKIVAENLVASIS